MDWKTVIRDLFAGEGHILDQDVLEELAVHAVSTYDAARSAGRSPAEAEQEVRALIAEWRREANLLQKRPRSTAAVAPPPADGEWIIRVIQDLRYALRLLRSQRSYALPAIVLMALGIGATATLFSVTYGVLERPLPWPDHERLVRVSESRKGATRQLPSLLTNASFLAWKDKAATIESLAAWLMRTSTLTSSTGAERIRVAEVTASLFDVLRSRPIVGTVFKADDETTGRVIVLSYGLWQQQFAGHPEVVGRKIELDRQSYVVVGVMAKEFSFPNRETRAWVPYRVPPVVGPDSSSRNLAMFNAIARLRDGVTPVQAAAEGTARAGTGPDLGMVATAVFGANGPADIVAVPILDWMTGSVRNALVILLAAGVLLLLTAVASVANLQIARAAIRRREMAIRAALGAAPVRLARQLLMESSLLGAAGGVFGLLLAAAVHIALPALLPADFPRVADVIVDVPVVIFTVLLAVAAGMAFGVLPAWTVRKLNLTEAFAADGSGTVIGSGIRSSRGRMLMMAAQVATACILLVGATLLLRTFANLTGADRGYDPANVLTARLSMPDFAYKPQQRAVLLDQILQRIEATPGVKHAAFTDGLPLTSYETSVGFTMRSHREPMALKRRCTQFSAL